MCFLIFCFIIDSQIYMLRFNKMYRLTKINTALLFILLFPMQCFATDVTQSLPSLHNYMFADAKACRSCIDAAGCERENRECASECNLTSFFTESEITECGTTCSVNWSACISKAKSGCTYECKEDS